MNLSKAVQTRRHEPESGVTIVLLALVMVALLIMAAIVVDLGGARQRRRQAQGTADASSLAGAQLLSTASPIASATAEAKTFALTNFNFSDWSNCTDPSPLPVTAAGTTCISFDSSVNPNRIRVYIPYTYTTAFGGVIGARSVKVSAAAVAQLGPAGSGAVLPFGVSAAATSGLICLKESPGGKATPPCNGGDSGNYHYLDIAQYGSTAMGTPQRCKTGTHDDRLRDNIAMGVDHALAIWSPSDDDVIDAAADKSNCSDSYNARPNTVDSQTGNINSLFTPAIATEPIGSTNLSDRKGGRLQRGSYVDSSTTILGTHLDNKPLWEFISTGSHPDTPNSCSRSVFDAVLSANALSPQTVKATAMRNALVQCFTDYAKNGGGSAGGCTGPCTGVLFDANTTTGDEPELVDIQYSARFGYAPKVCSLKPPTASCTSGPKNDDATWPSGSSGNVRITNLVPIFLQQLFGKNIDFEPGVGYSGGAGNADGITAFVLDPNMLPRGLGDPGAAFEFGKGTFVTLVK